MYPAGILKNTKTGKFHPILFRRHPLPSEGAWDENTVQRHKSLGHHTEGFETMEAAKLHIEENAECTDRGGVWEWDGEGIPAIVHWF